MRCSAVLVLALAATIHGFRHHNKHCKKHLNTINFGVRDAYCDQPLFVTFLQKTEENLLLDNICHTFFPLPDDPETFQLYISKVYCDGSSEIISFVTTQMEVGITKFGSPYCTCSDTVFGYAGCDTYLIYRCFEFGGHRLPGLIKYDPYRAIHGAWREEEVVEEIQNVSNPIPLWCQVQSPLHQFYCGSVDGTLVFGLSPQPYTIGISCLRKVEEIVESAHIRAHEYYVLPMKLPNRCVTQQLCLAPSNPFYNHLPGHRSSSKLH